MCGIFGGFSNVSASEIKKCSDTLKHRGPDDSGIFLKTSYKQSSYALDDTSTSSINYFMLENLDSAFREDALFLGHRRLSILELSPLGYQPMSCDGTVIVFNGEIYNYIELKKELSEDGFKFISDSDTEVIIKAYQKWGYDCVRHFNGMWSFVLYDPKKEKLFCSRDRFGVKPFYYFYDSKSFIFASEIKGLFCFETVSKKFDIQKVKRFIVWENWEHTQDTFFEGIMRLIPGYNLILDLKTMRISQSKYYEITPPQNMASKSLEECAHDLGSIFLDSVRIRLRSDVRIGTCFSGGVDSSAIVYAINDILKKESISSIGKNQFPFSSVFKSDKKYAPFDESKWIELGAKDTGAVLVETEPTVEKLISDIQKLAWHQDEPFKTMSIFSSWCVMEQARKNGVTVTLDGQGPDETVGGYNDIFYVKLASDLANFNLPLFVKDLNGFYSNFGLSKKMLLKNSLSKFRISPKTLLKHSLALSAKVFEAPSEVPNVKTHRLENKNVNKQLKLLVQENLSVLLRYADRNSMAFSVESRMPWLDYRLVDYCFSLEQGYKVAQGWSKLVERKAIEAFTNKEIAWRKSKLGFPAPQELWLKEEKFQKVYTDYINNSRILRDLKLKKSVEPRWDLMSVAVWEKVMGL